MQNNIPVPTDNIFKFYALFGLLLFVFSCGSFLYVISSANSLVFEVIPELEGLKQNSKPSTVEGTRIALLERKLEITKSNKTFFLSVIGGLICVSVSAMGYGFWKWHVEVQPVLDEKAKVHLEIAKLQLEELRRGLGKNAEPQPQPVSDVAVQSFICDQPLEDAKQPTKQ